MIALALPEEVLDALRTVHTDPGWAIVRLVETSLLRGHRQRPKGPVPVAELVHLPGRRALIVVQPQAFAGLDGVSTVPLADGRAILAFDRPVGIADLELAVLDRLDRLDAGSAERERLTHVRNIVRGWRRHPDLVMQTKSILVVDGAVGVDRRPLEQLQSLRRDGGHAAPRRMASGRRA